MNRNAGTSSSSAPRALQLFGPRTVLAVALALCVYGSILSRAEASAPLMQVQGASGTPGDDVTLGVVLRTNGAVVASTTSEVLLDRQILIAAAGSKGDCTANAAIGNAIADFRFSPNGCNPAEDCEGVRGVVLTTDVVPDGTVLFTCRAHISATASHGDHAVRLNRAAVSDPQGNETQADVAAGAVTVVGQLGEVARPAGATSTKTSDGGCNLAPERAPGVMAFLVLAPALLLGWRRRARVRRAGGAHRR